MPTRKPEVGGTSAEKITEKDVLRKLLDALEIDDEMVKKYTTDTRQHSEKATRGIKTEFDMHKAAWDMREKFLKLAKEAGDLPDKLMEKAVEAAKEYVAAGGVKYYENNLKQEKIYAKLFAIMNVPEFIKHPQAKDVLEAFISNVEAHFPMKFEAYLNYESGEGYSLMEQIDESYIKNLEGLVNDPRLWEGERGNRYTQNSEVRRILFANVASILNLLAEKGDDLDRATLDARMNLMENNIAREGHIETQAAVAWSLNKSEIGRKALEELAEGRPASVGGVEAAKILTGYYSRVLY